MNKNLLKLLSLFVCASLYNVSISQCTIDQTYTGANTLQSPVGSNIVLPDGQSFQAGLTGALNSVSLDLSATNLGCLLSSMDVQVDILDGDGIAGTILDSEIFTIPVDFARTMHTFNFTSPALVTATQMYTVIITLVPLQDCGSGEPVLIWYFDFPTGFWASTGGTQYQDGIITSLGNTQYFNTCVGTPCSETTSSFNETACDTYTVPSGDETYTVSGVYMDTIPNMAGCDSVMTITLTIIDATTSSISITACTMYTVPSGDETYSTSGVYMDTIPNMAGCDSVMTINLTIIDPVTSAFSITECDMYTVPSGDEFYTLSGVYMDTIPSMAGCDSVMTITLTIINSTDTNLTAAACISYKLNATTYTTSGIKTQTLVNSVGCDSIITLDLTIYPVNITITQNGSTLSADTLGVWFQWLDCNNGMAPIPGEYYIDFSPAVDGDYAVIVTTLNCSDTSACFSIDNVGLGENNSAGTISVYPNPTNGLVTITTGAQIENATIKLINLSGQVLIQENNLTGSTFNLDLSEFSNGVYFVEISEGENIQRIKIVRN